MQKNCVARRHSFNTSLESGKDESCSAATLLCARDEEETNAVKAMVDDRTRDTDIRIQ